MNALNGYMCFVYYNIITEGSYGIILLYVLQTAVFYINVLLQSVTL